MENTKKEDLKVKIENEGLRCDCGETIYKAGSGGLEKMPNYNPYFEYLECTRCHKVFYL